MSSPTPPGSHAFADVVIVGAGAAGLATAIFTARRAPHRRVLILDGARSPGAKILVSGGGRCNVTNAVISERDFNGGRPGAIRRILRALPIAATVEFFRDIGVPLHEEERGKLFPDSHRARDVLNALLAAAAQAGAVLLSGRRVISVRRTNPGFVLETSQGPVAATAVVLATGGLSLPKTGSDGAGYEFARQLGHGLVPTTPALVPLRLDDRASHAVHTSLSGVSHEARLLVRRSGAVTPVEGPLLWTHFGISGPVALDASRHLLRGRLEGDPVTMAATLTPAHRFEDLEGEWIERTRRSPRTTIAHLLSGWLPASVANAVLKELRVSPVEALADVPRDTRRTVIHSLLDWPLTVADSRGYDYAEVTAGGVPLAEIDPSTMASRTCPDLYFVGEVLDVDGRLGGFNFQWAWCTAAVAGAALAARPWRDAGDPDKT